VGTTVFFVAVALRFGVQGLRVETSASVIVMVVAFLYFASISVALAVIDLETHTLPDRIVLSAYPVAAILVGAAAVVSGEPQCLFWALLGGLMLFLLYFLMAALYPKGMGLGDVKLAGVIGIFLGLLGPGPFIVGAFGAFVLGGAFSLVLLATRRAGRGSGIPFGPWMLAGAWLGVFAGEPIATGYLTLVGLN
jgi:leader peptidase (prepilin peptidase)/N-methyltransferase